MKDQILNAKELTEAIYGLTEAIYGLQLTNQPINQEKSIELNKQRLNYSENDTFNLLESWKNENKGVISEDYFIFSELVEVLKFSKLKFSFKQLSDILDQLGYFKKIWRNEFGKEGTVWTNNPQYTGLKKRELFDALFNKPMSYL